MSEIISISVKDHFLNRLKEAVDFTQSPWVSYEALDDVIDVSGKLTPKLILISVVDIEAKEEVAGQVQTLRQFFADAFILVLAAKRMSLSDALFVKKSGGNFVILAPAYLTTIRLEYILNQVVKTSFIPVGADDFKEGTVLDFAVYTRLKLNNKIVPVIHPGTLINQPRLDKLKLAEDLQVRRSQVELFSKYINDQQDSSATGVSRRCRVQLQTLANIHVNLVLTLTDQAESGSFGKGKDLIQKFSELCDNLLKNLIQVLDPWEIIDRSIFGSMGVTDRSMVIACLAALTSFRTHVGDPKDILMAGLFCDLGLLDLSPASLNYINTLEGRKRLILDDLQIYQSHPVISLNALLERKLQLSEKVKEIILCTHEKADRTGFPNQVLPEKIPIESFLLMFHEWVDIECRPQPGKERPSFLDVRRKIYAQERENPQHFSILFLEKIKSSF